MEESGTRSNLPIKKRPKSSFLDRASMLEHKDRSKEEALEKATLLLGQILEELNLSPLGQGPVMACQALMQPCQGGDDNEFLLKLFLSCPGSKFEQGSDPRGECQRREHSFYRFLDVVDRDRCFVNVPRLIVADPGDPPLWMLFEGIEGLRVPVQDPIRPDWLLDAMKALQRLPLKLTHGRRGLMLERWDPYAHREVIFQMRDRVEPKVGVKAWDLLCRTLHEAREWTDTQEPVLVYGRFQEDLLLLDDMERIYLHDFRRSGWGNPDHDFGWFWTYTKKDQEFKEHFYHLYCSGMGSSERARVEWAARSIGIYKACLDIAEAGPDVDISADLESLERSIMGGSNLFP